VGRLGGSMARTGGAAVPLYETVLAWVEGLLGPRGYGRPLSKRLAVLVSGLVASDTATLGAIGASVAALEISGAREESVARRLQRIAGDPRLDPGRLLGEVLGPVLPALLAGRVAAHAANERSGAGHHGRFVGVRVVLDESSQAEHVHLLVAGVPVGGVVVPLAVRCWAQNAPLPEGAYWAEVAGLLADVQALLPPPLRAHALLVADRQYGVPRLVDLAAALGWGWLLRVQGQTRVRLPDGTERALRELAPRPGTRWAGAGAADPVGVFKAAGWRASRVAAVWAVGADEPWLLVTSLDGAADRVREYARRWAIERLFLAWKSRGWDVEASGVRQPARLGRLLTGLALATLWRLAIALPRAQQHLADLAARAAGQPRAPRQLPLPWAGPAAPAPRPWAAKFSLLSWGAKIARQTTLRTHTPDLCWTVPAWDAPTWADQCRLARRPAP
jgi:hypothetical protein